MFNPGPRPFSFHGQALEGHGKLRVRQYNAEIHPGG